MPILDVGYRAWSGVRTNRLWRWLVVAQTCFILAFRGTWVRRLLYFGFAPALLVGLGFFAFEQALTERETRAMVATAMQRTMRRPDLAKLVQQSPEEARGPVWAQFIFAYFRYPQLLLMVVMFGTAAPRMISFDLRSRAHLLYFSRPLGPAEYLLGKSAVLWGILALFTVIPAGILYFMGVMFSPDPTAFWQTWDLPFRIIAAGLVLAIPTTALALCFSALTHESRYAAFAWYMTWVLGWVTYGIVLAATRIRVPRGERRLVDLGNIRLVSPYHTLVHLESWVFGVLPDQSGVAPALALVIVTTLACTLVTYWRIARQLRQ